MFRIRSLRAPALAAGLFTLASCSKAERSMACNDASDCPAGVKCVLGACVAGNLPMAAITLRSGTGLVTHRPLVFDGTGSNDPNPGGSVVAYSWSVKRAAGTHCDPSPARGTESVLATIFMCEGDYQIALMVKNDLGLESAPATMAITVAPSTNPPAVSPGQDVTLAHRCSGAPLVCSPIIDDGTGKLQLAVDAMDVESGRALEYSWEWEPPPGADRSSVSVRFDPGPQVSTPLVHIESAGTRIAGEWIFTVGVTDGDGLVTLAQQKVTITNSAPTLAPEADTVLASHTYNGQAYVAVGELLAQIQDPDGDPIELPELRLAEDVATGCAFRVNRTTLTDGVLDASFDLTALPGQEAAFIGPQRKIEVLARDVNGGEATASAALTILNRPPSFAWAPGIPGEASRLVDVPHSATNDCASPAGCYLARGASPLQAVDPDGDPLGLVELLAFDLGGSSTFASGDGRSFVVKTDVNAPSQFRGGDGVSPLTLAARVRDPWSSSEDAAARFRIRIGNTPPHAVSPPSGVEVSHWYSDSEKNYHAQADFVAFVDYDGDPIHLGPAAPDPYCSEFSVVGAGVGRVTCTHHYDWTGGAVPDVSSFLAAHAVRLSAKDPWEEGPSTPSTVTVRDYNAPTNPGGGLVAEACTCVAGVICEPPTYQRSPYLSFSLPIGDPDLAPVQVRLSTPSCGKLTSAALFGAMRGANVQLDLSGCGDFRTSMSVAVSDGLLSTYATYDIRAGCSKTDVRCGLPSRPPPGMTCP